MNVNSKGGNDVQVQELKTQSLSGVVHSGACGRQEGHRFLGLKVRGEE